MMTKEQFLHRPDDIPLPRIWEEMRQNQRELEWPGYWMNAQMANCQQQTGNAYLQRGYSNDSLWANLFGDLGSHQ